MAIQGTGSPDPPDTPVRVKSTILNPAIIHASRRAIHVKFKISYGLHIPPGREWNV